MRNKILLVAGARPNFMKLGPLWPELERAPEFEPVLVHTGQHYDEALSGQFLRELGLPRPAHCLEVGSGSHAGQTARILERMEPVMEAEQPAAVLVVGDVNSTLGAALVAAKMGIPVVHVEAGLRSFDRSMPEEVNRLAVDAISDLLLASEESGMRNLRAEGIPESRMRLVGNLMIDSLRGNLAKAVKPEIAGAYGVVTLHRAANVDDPARLAELLGTLEVMAKRQPLYFPVHPRTRARMESAGLGVSERIHLREPLGYVEFLGLVAGASVVLTDSGGIQEETTVLGVPCLTLRENTERPATVEQGTNVLAGTRRETILAAWAGVDWERRGRVPVGWDGKAAGRVVLALREFFAGREVGERVAA